MTRRSATRPLRIFLGPLEVSGIYQALEAGFRELGQPARLITTHPHPYGYGQAEPNPWPARIAAAAVLRHRRAHGARRLALGAVYLLSSIVLLFWTLPRFDSYIFGWGWSILPGNLDIPVLRLFGKRVVVVIGHGSEARPPYMSTPAFPMPPDEAATDALVAETAAVAAKVRRLERWASVIVGLPATGQFLTRPFVNFYRLGVPTVARPAERAPAPVPGTITVLHVPSKPEVKGSVQIREAMAQIESEYPQVTYLELSSRPHEEILAAMRASTFVVDCLWCDIPLDAVGAESSSLGKATIISGYGWESWKKFLPEEEWPPSIRCTPETLIETIRESIDDLGATLARGLSAQDFIARRWSPAAVAANYLRVVEEAHPADWVVVPSDVDYGWGNGVSRENVIAMVRAMVDRRGIRSLEWPRAAEVYGLDAD